MYSVPDLEPVCFSMSSSVLTHPYYPIFIFNPSLLSSKEHLVFHTSLLSTNVPGISVMKMNELNIKIDRSSVLGTS